MFTHISRTLAAAALLVGFATAVTLADTPATSYHYNTALTELYGSPSPYSGTLDLRIDADGIVNGYYHPEDPASFVQVTGGRDGNRIWLDIGQKGEIHVSGTIVNGTITGQAVYSDDQSGLYAFKATPSKEPGT